MHVGSVQKMLCVCVQAHVGSAAAACQAVPVIRLPSAPLPRAAGDEEAADVTPGGPAKACLSSHAATAGSGTQAAAAAAVSVRPVS